MINPWQNTLLERQSKRKEASTAIPSARMEPSPDNKQGKNTTPEPVKKIYNEAKQEILKTEIKAKEQNERRLDKLLNYSSTVIFRAKTVFPFTFFPDEIVITLNDVNVIFEEFFLSKQVRSLSISKIAEVVATTGFFFAQVRIIDKEFSQMSITVDYLKIADAMKIKRLIQGLLFSSAEKVDLTKVGKEGLVNKIEELGRIQGEELDKL
jgi:hypothetical protein